MKFASKNYDSILDFMSWEMITKGLKLGVFTTLLRYVQKYFSTSKVQKIVEYPLVFLGTAPQDAPALYNIMSHVDFNLGLFYPDWWIYAVVDALVSITKKYNVTIETSNPVKKILVDPDTKQVRQASTVTNFTLQSQ